MGRYNRGSELGGAVEGREVDLVACALHGLQDVLDLGIGGVARFEVDPDAAEEGGGDGVVDVEEGLGDVGVEGWGVEGCGFC